MSWFFLTWQRDALEWLLSSLEVDAFSWFLIQLWHCLIGYLSQHFGIFKTEKDVQRCIPLTILGFEMEVF